MGNRECGRLKGNPCGPLRLNTINVTMPYPRVCGGTASRAQFSTPLQGLSPRVRGNPGTARLRPVSQGSIPACAGEPELNELANRIGRVYPRVCGGTKEVWTEA